MEPNISEFIFDHFPYSDYPNLLWLAKKGRVVRFQGQHIAGLVEVDSNKPLKLGKDWGRHYSLMLGHGVTPILLHGKLIQEHWPSLTRKEAYKSKSAFSAISEEEFSDSISLDFPAVWEAMVRNEKKIERIEYYTDVVRINVPKNADLIIGGLILPHDMPEDTLLSGIVKVLSVQEHDSGVTLTLEVLADTPVQVKTWAPEEKPEFAPELLDAAISGISLKDELCSVNQR